MLILNCPLFAQNGWETVFTDTDRAPGIWDMKVYGNYVLACGFRGKFFISTDNGTSWKKVYVGTDSDLREIFVLNSQTAWICGEYGTIIKYNLESGKYYDYSISSRYKIESIAFFNDQNGIATADHGLILRTANGGMNWDSIFCAGDYYAGHFAVDEHSNAYAAFTKFPVASSVVLKSQDAGLSWSVLVNFKDERINRVYKFNDELWLIGSFGLMVKSTDEGKSWEWFDKKYNKSYWSLVVLPEEHYVAAGSQDDGIMVSGYGASAWVIDLEATGHTIVNLASNGEYLFTHFVDPQNQPHFRFMRKRIR